jgi:CBS domain-containing protein
MKVRDVMSPDVEVLRPNDTLQTAAQLMADLDAAVLPVGEDDDRLIGMITDRDIAMRVAAEGRDPQEVTVRQAMSSDVLYCFEDESVEDVSEKMGGWWVRRMPVVNRDKCLIGTVSLGALTSLPIQR